MHDTLKQVDRAELQLRLASEADLLVLARIHKTAYSRSHFTALLSAKTLAFYYGHFLTDGAEICLATDGDDILGFAVYGVRLPERITVFKKAAARDILLASLRNPVMASRKLLNAVLAKLSVRQTLVATDFLLLSIAVAKPMCGVGGCLLRYLASVAQQRGMPAVGLYVNADNINAINVYFAAGFVMKHHHCGQFYMEKHLEK